MQEKTSIKLIKVSKTFQNLDAVVDLNLSVKKGEIYALIGPNGAGKTTTVKMITGIMAPTSGDIQILGQSIIKTPVVAKKLLGYIPDDPFVYDYLTGREFLQLVGDLYGLNRQETDAKISELLKIYNLDGIIDGLFSEYSRGNKQKTIIIANLLHNPQVLVIDEPILGLDVQSQKITKKIFKDFASRGGTIFVCTHTMSVAQEIADRIGILKAGKLIEEGTMGELRKIRKESKADLEELYLGVTGKKP
jgi:ABC-2 type transport system ATP-binding protein